MAERQSSDRKQSRSKREKEKADSGGGENGHKTEATTYEQELAGYLQQRIKPGLNSGAIPLLARSIAKEIAHRAPPNGETEDAEVEDQPSAETEEQPSAETEDQPSAETDEEPSAETDEEPDAEADEEPSAEAGDEAEADADDEPSAEADDAGDAQAAFEGDMHDLQAELGEDWILRFSVQGDEAWLTAEKEDGSQRVEGPTAAVISEAVALLNEAGGRSG